MPKGGGPNREHGEDDPIGAESVTAPATVSGEGFGKLGHWATGKAAGTRRPASQETCHAKPPGLIARQQLVARRVFMTARTVSSSLSLSQRVAAGLALVFVGATLFFAVGLSNMAVAHNTAHDTRHAIGFPCH
jgi:cobalt transporter subunit CbtB